MHGSGRPCRRKGNALALRLMHIRSIVVGTGPIASLIVLTPAEADAEGQEAPQVEVASTEGGTAGMGASQPVLPIRIGAVEAAAISMGIGREPGGRPMTHDLLLSVIDALGGTVDDVRVVGVSGTTFFAEVNVADGRGGQHLVDARPSDAMALAVRTGCPIYADESVLGTAALPDFAGVEHSEQEQSMADFHDFVETLSPDDFEAK